MNAQVAIHASAQAGVGQSHMARTPATRFTALLVIGDDQSIPVKHGALKSCIRTHVLAHLLAHETCITVSSKAVKEHPEHFPGAHAGLEKLHAQFMDRCEISNKSKARPYRQAQPEYVLISFLYQLFQ